MYTRAATRHTPCIVKARHPFITITSSRVALLRLALGVAPGGRRRLPFLAAMVRVANFSQPNITWRCYVIDCSITIRT